METDDYTSYSDSHGDVVGEPTKQEGRNRKLEEIGILVSDEKLPQIMRKIKNIFKILGD
jgi:hypothetical protein